MLDSLVRVSRRVGGNADLLAADPAGHMGRQAFSRRVQSQERRARAQGLNFTPFLGPVPADRDARPGEMLPPTEPMSRPSPRGSRTETSPRRQPEPPEPTSRMPPLTTTQFHVLLNSLFKVLFNFPSRYLFAIGLGVIFSLTWSLPRTLSCTPKQLDSREKPAQRSSRLTGLSPSTGRGPSQGGLGLAAAPR